jgi:hypothetical protein
MRVPLVTILVASITTVVTIASAKSRSGTGVVLAEPFSFNLSIKESRATSSFFDSFTAPIELTSARTSLEKVNGNYTVHGRANLRIIIPERVNGQPDEIASMFATTYSLSFAFMRVLSFLAFVQLGGQDRIQSTSFTFWDSRD